MGTCIHSNGHAAQHSCEHCICEFRLQASLNEPGPCCCVCRALRTVDLTLALVLHAMPETLQWLLWLGFGAPASACSESNVLRLWPFSVCKSRACEQIIPALVRSAWPLCAQNSCTRNAQLSCTPSTTRLCFSRRRQSLKFRQSEPRQHQAIGATGQKYLALAHA